MQAPHKALLLSSQTEKDGNAVDQPVLEGTAGKINPVTRCVDARSPRRSIHILSMRGAWHPSGESHNVLIRMFIEYNGKLQEH
jgi:hypothetical protein